MNQAAQWAFIGSETCRMIEAAKTGAAGRTDARLIERERIEKRRVTDGAVIIRVQRPG